MVVLLSTRRLAMVRRMLERVTARDLRAAPGAGIGAGAAARGAAGAVVPPAMAASTSLRTMRPEGPVPPRFLRSTPASAAIFLARGEAKTRSPAGVAAC